MSVRVSSPVLLQVDVQQRNLRVLDHLRHPLRGPHAHQRGAQIHPPLAPTAARRYSSGRQPMHLIDERPPELRSNRGMDLIAVQAPLHP